MPPCKDCGIELLFVKTHTDVPVPVEKNTPVMAVYLDEFINFKASKAPGHEALNDEKAAYLAVHICRQKKTEA